MKRIFSNLVPMSLVGIVCLSTVAQCANDKKLQRGHHQHSFCGRRAGRGIVFGGCLVSGECWPELASVFGSADEPAGFSPLQFAQARSAFAVNFQASRRHHYQL